MVVEIRKVTEDKKGMKQFMRLPWTLYRDDPYCAPDLVMDLKKKVEQAEAPIF